MQERVTVNDLKLSACSDHLHMGDEAATLIDQGGTGLRPLLPLLDAIEADDHVLDSAFFRDEEPIVRDRLAEDIHILCWPDNVGLRYWALIRDRARDRAAAADLSFFVCRAATRLSGSRFAESQDK